MVSMTIPSGSVAFGAPCRARLALVLLSRPRKPVTVRGLSARTASKFSLSPYPAVNCELGRVGGRVNK